jgi:hypothetical protein
MRAGAIETYAIAFYFELRAGSVAVFCSRADLDMRDFYFGYARQGVADEGEFGF